MMKYLAFLISNIYIVLASQDNTKCRPFPVMVPTDSTNDNFIIVHQCRGRDLKVNNPNIQCVSEKADPLKIEICGEQVYNHTKCKMETVCGNDQDSVKNLRPGVCYFHEVWNPKECKCECKKCDSKKTDSKSSTKKGSSSSLSIELDLFIIALVGEFLLLVSIAYIIRRLRKSQKNSTSNIKEGIKFERNESYCKLSTQQQQQNENQ